MDWYDLTDKYHGLAIDSDADLECLPEEWQRELAALWRLEADVNNGGYLQFLQNWGVRSHEYALAALKKIDANRMENLVSECYSILKNEVDPEQLDQDQLLGLLPNEQVGSEGVVKPEPVLSQTAMSRIYELSYEFMDYPDDLPTLGSAYYQQFTS
jgi:hypothetical protein